MKNTKFIAQRKIIDKETGVVLDSPDYAIKVPKLTKVNSRFLKVCERAVYCLARKDLAKLSLLQPYLEWQTNRLVNKHVGRYPVPIKQKDMALLLNVHERTISSLISTLKDENGIFIFDSQYYLNPSFVGSSESYDTEIIIKMIQKDPQLKSYLKKDHLEYIESFVRVENMPW